VSRAGEQRALYLRWRPGRFAQVLGQDHVTRTLRNAVRTGQVAHAYLFCGPRGTGKTSIARILFKAINCEQPQDGDACDACEICQEAAGGRALDLVEIDAASNRGIDHIRELRERVWVAPARARRKMYILDEAHQLSAPAWDAFLKTLEEPPPHVVFVLATTEVHKVPATILSRCQRFDLGRIALSALVAHLAKVAAAEGLQVEPAALQCVARRARGSVRDALSMLDQLLAYSPQGITLQTAREVLGLTAAEVLQQVAEALARQDARAALALVNTLARDGADLQQFLDDLVAHLRALLLARLGGSEALEWELGAEERAQLEGQVEHWRPGQLLALIRRLSAIDPRGRDASDLQVQLELALLDAALAGGEAAWRDGGAAWPPAPAGSAPPAAAARVADAGPPPVAAVGAATAAPGNSGEAQEAQPPAASAPPEGNGRTPAVTPVDLTLIRSRWTEIKEAVAAAFPIAGIALEAAQVAGGEGGDLLLAFTSEFHQRTIERDAACRAAIEQLLAERFGVRCRLRCVPAEMRQPGLPGDEFLRQAAELFGAIGIEPVSDPPAAGEEHEP
jgi:DNA polymerase-3 subunit gamma/tau